MNLTIETNGGGQIYVKASDPTKVGIFWALIATGLGITVTGGTNAVPGTYYPDQTIGGNFFRLSGAVATGSSPVTGITATVPDFVKVLSPPGNPIITSGNVLQVPVPTISEPNGQVQMRLRLFLNYDDTNPVNSAFVNYTGTGQILEMPIPSQFLNRFTDSNKIPPFFTVEVKDTVGDWPAVGWLMLGDYMEARLSPAQGGYYAFYAPLAPPPATNSELLALLPAARLSGKHVTVALMIDSISDYVYSAYDAFLGTLYPGNFSIIDGGVAGKGSSDFLPNAVNVHPNSTSGENYYNYILHGLQAASASGDVIVCNYFAGTNHGGESATNDPIIINALKAALPNLIIIVHPCRTFARNFQPNKNDNGAYLSASNAQRAIADASQSDLIFHGTEKYYPYFLTHADQIDLSYVHPLPGAGQDAQVRFWLESLLSILAVQPAFALPMTLKARITSAVVADSFFTTLAAGATFTYVRPRSGSRFDLIAGDGQTVVATLRARVNADNSLTVLNVLRPSGGTSSSLNQRMPLPTGPDPLKASVLTALAADPFRARLADGTGFASARVVSPGRFELLASDGKAVVAIVKAQENSDGSLVIQDVLRP